MPMFQDMYGVFDWEPLDVPDEEMGDHQSVDWVIDQLGREHDRPFFLAAGIYKPHLPWYVPARYFDLFPLDSVELPDVLEGDLADVPERGIEIAYRGGEYHRHVLEAGQWPRAVQGYLASIAFADAQVGRLLDALDASPYARNTIVVLWSDHGWQLGEKEHWRKFALWENVSRIVLVVRVPEGTPGLGQGTRAGTRSGRTVSLVDLFPTLLDLAGLPAREGLDGRSLVPLLADPVAPWDRPVVTTYEYGEHTVRDERWRYIRYIDGSEELYDHERDPEEWTNLAGDPARDSVKARLAAWLPSDPAPFVETSIDLLPHHIPPLRGVEDYLDRKARGALR
jgi:arylsulfatase A-like enzyme